jgi:hypothetical protein
LLGIRIMCASGTTCHITILKYICIRKINTNYQFYVQYYLLPTTWWHIYAGLSWRPLISLDVND